MGRMGGQGVKADQVGEVQVLVDLPALHPSGEGLQIRGVDRANQSVRANDPAGQPLGLLPVLERAHGHGDLVFTHLKSGMGASQVEHRIDQDALSRGGVAVESGQHVLALE